MENLFTVVILKSVGDPVADHKCWVQPEDMDTPRTVHKVTPSDPGSDVAGETAAALAASSRVFEHLDAHYSKTLLETAEKAFNFANRHRAKYSDSLHSAVCPFYCSYSGYLDELQWAAAWLYQATKNSSYLQYAISTAAENDCDVFSWDNKLPGTRYSLVADGGDKSAARFGEEAKRYICSMLPNLQYTPGGLMYKMNATNLQYVTTSTFLFTAYAKYLKTSKETFSCGSMINYILGDNPKGMSYMVGYGEKYPQRIHHRGSSLPSLQQKSEPFGCGDAFQSYYYTSEPNPNILIGAVVGGPNHDDKFYDDRDNYAQSEPATYINAPLVGSLAYLAASFGS
ncbi:Endoglucanase 3 [Vitis vinifera]|uniref:Endoglucanase n=1 Tax=Vitis vinifera TaxID=29760 RepID=A0A438C8A3_VITVI|nr:Endoglucanase 3 [Vitis vinifera]